VLAEDWPPAGVVPDRSAWLSQEQPADQVQAIRRRTLTGRPCGGDSLLERLERLLARPLKPRKPGRPKKTKAAE
jgi:hypothetical protein